MTVKNAELKITAGLVNQFPYDGKAQVAFSGRSNVGKSSLINTLMGRKSLARVSSAPGKTITINFYEINKEFYLVDMPGYGYAKRSPEQKKQWSALTDGYYTKDGSHGKLKVVAQLVDLKAGATNDDLMMMEWLSQSGLDWFIVATKADKLNKTERAKALAALSELVDGVDIIPYSSLNGEGKNDVWNRIGAALAEN
ncbi:MAG: YihA family ribosome biogenesis GTP-binding protein [Ruminococcaceae bacterium]|nr:YihA family ribosome biogenesis GTP-binding protein [Oscillospiraceae bacterium]